MDLKTFFIKKNVGKLDGYIIAGLFLLSGVLATCYYKSHWGIWKTANFYQFEIFAPAVNFACGGTLDDPGIGNRRLANFLSTNFPDFPCDQLRGVKTAPMNSFQFSHFYMVAAFGWAWKILGVTWNSIAPLIGLFFALTTVTCFFLLRGFLSSGMSALLTLVFLSSPNHFSLLPGFRDYSKGFFVLFLLVLTTYLVIPKRYGVIKRWYLPALISGSILGIGYRFRSDVVVIVPFMCMSVLLFASREILPGFKRKVGFLAVFFLSFWSLAYLPTLKVPHPATHPWGSAGAGNFLIGQMSNQTEDLGIKAPSYEIGQSATDIITWTLMASYHERLNGKPNVLYYYPGDISGALSWYSAILFPADLITRWITSALNLTRLPFWKTSSTLLSFYPNGTETTRKWIEWRYDTLEWAGFIAPWIAIAALFILLFVDLKIGLFLIALELYCLGYPSLRFQDRHFFHVEPLALLLVGIFLEMGLKIILSIRKEMKWVQHRMKTASIASTACLFIVGSAILFTRIYQIKQAQTYADVLQSQLRVPVILPSKDYKKALKSQEKFLPVSGDFELPPGLFKTEYLGIATSGDTCRKNNIRLDLVYEGQLAAEPSFGRSKKIDLIPGEGKKTYFFPAYWYDNAHFTGVRVSDEDRKCVSSFFRLAKTPPFPFLLSFLIADKKSRNRLYQQINLNPCDGTQCRTWL